MGCFAFVILCATICCTAVLIQWLISESYVKHDVTKNCWKDYEQNQTVCSLSCGNKSFALAGMMACRKWLDCQDNVTVKHVIVQSIVKTVYLAEWKGYLVVMSKLSSLEYEDDFRENLKILIMLGPNPFTVQFLGHCGNVIYTRYHRFGSALNLNHHLHNSLQLYDNIIVRLNFCVKYVQILNYLHTGPIGTRVMCDSNTLEKTLSQYLLTENLGLVINDLDAVPQVGNGSGVLCGKRQLFGTFVAPEQTWPYEQEFSPELMQPYDEKVDIWKIPDVCLWFLGNNSETDIVKFKVFNLHKMCKSKDPSMRPSALSVLEAYENVMNDLKRTNKVKSL